MLGFRDAFNATRYLDGTEKTTLQIRGFARGATAVSESGLYALIMRSSKPEAQRFRKWVTSVVLPAIRKDGAYVMGEEKAKTGEMAEDELIARALVAVQIKLKRLEEERERLLPAAQGYDKFLNTEGTD